MPIPQLKYEIERKPWSIYGGKNPFFLRYAKVIEDVIKDFNLEPLKDGVYGHTRMLAEKSNDLSTKAMIYFDPDIWGGKRFAHLHLRDEVYALNRDQWNSFTSRIKNDLVERLEKANSISLEQIQELSDAIDPIA